MWGGGITIAMKFLAKKNFKTACAARAIERHHESRAAVCARLTCMRLSRVSCALRASPIYKLKKAAAKAAKAQAAAKKKKKKTTKSRRP